MNWSIIVLITGIIHKQDQTVSQPPKSSSNSTNPANMGRGKETEVLEHDPNLS